VPSEIVLLKEVEQPIRKFCVMDPVSFPWIGGSRERLKLLTGSCTKTIKQSVLRFVRAR